ncbi:hypothetical protein DNTS_005829 [Danionella cerebrum]|uniref:DUF4503 domain-containing protein n=1 Tax=Danionella cerebrum TaxID=2873325 RepID=A0A553QJW7_9TELE|nr:hypothetical protein DNTS_005829 [Danionella translucida]
MGKRKKNAGMRCVLFPDDVKNTFTKAGKVPSGRPSTSNSWVRCGESFLDSSLIQKLQDKKSRTIIKAPESADAGTDEAVHIAWSSSEEEGSDINNSPHPLRKAAEPAHKQRPADHQRKTDEMPTIDSDSEVEEDKSTSKEIMKSLFPEPSPAEISDYSSYEDNDEDPGENNGESSLLEAADSSKRSVSDWIRSAQAILQTPQKQPSKSFKTPEDSSKKRRRFERPGVLILRILGVREECAMQAAVCERLHEGQTCVALFNKDTAAKIQPAPRDIIHIYPPWQNLVLEGERYPVILNTHFSQKVCMETNSDPLGDMRGAVAVEKCRAPPLTWSLWRFETSQLEGQKCYPWKEVVELNRAGARLSLLDAVEDCGSSGSVEVVVQRVYCTPIIQSINRASLHLRAQGKPPVDPAAQHIGRINALVQDTSGMFGEVLLQSVSSESEIQQISEHLEGRVCLLGAMRVVQRLTRERCSSLFSLMDSFWPPPPDPESLADLSSDSIPAPSFCYRLSVQQGHMTPLSAQSPLYRPPVLQTLREILQDESLSCRCSFRAVVIYKQTPSSRASEQDLLLFVTDPSLQTQVLAAGNPRTTILCLSSSCLIQSAVSRALESQRNRLVLRIRDAVKEHGQIFCCEQTVIQLEPENTTFSIPQPITLDQLGPETPPYSLCTLTGVIVAVDESTAFSWPICRHCESCHLQTHEPQRGFLCLECGAVMEEANVKMQLEVFLSCSSLNQTTVKVKLHQKTIRSLLSSTRCTEGYSVEHVLGLEVGPLSAFVHTVNRGQTLWIGLEELSLD